MTWLKKRLMGTLKRKIKLMSKKTKVKFKFRKLIVKVKIRHSRLIYKAILTKFSGNKNQKFNLIISQYCNLMLKFLK